MLQNIFMLFLKKTLLWKCKSGEKEGLIFQPCGLFLPETLSLCGTWCWLITDFGADCMFVKTMNSIYRSHACDSEKFSIFKHILHIRLLELFFSRFARTETFKSTYLLIGNFLSFLCLFSLGVFLFFLWNLAEPKLSEIAKPVGN